MKNQFVAAIVAVGFGLIASSASAAPTAFTANQKVTKNECALLAESVTLGVSSKVHGGYNCDEALNLVQVGACHEGGSRAGVTCVAIVDPQDATKVTYPAGCSAATVGEQSSVPSYKSFFTSSAGGVMVEYPMDGRCSDATIVGIDGFKK